MIQTFHVSKQYSRENVALTDVTLEIDKGEFVFLTGPSGAGKTTFLKLIFREETPTSGQILVNGRNVSAIPEAKIPYLRRDIGVVFQCDPPSSELVDLAVRAEQAGFSHVWTFDSHLLWQEPFVIYSQILDRTSRVVVGPMVLVLGPIVVVLVAEDPEAVVVLEGVEVVVRGPAEVVGGEARAVVVAEDVPSPPPTRTTPPAAPPATIPAMATVPMPPAPAPTIPVERKPGGSAAAPARAAPTTILGAFP